MPIIQLNKNNRIIIPKTISKKINLQIGDKIYINELNGKIVIEKIKSEKLNSKEMNQLIEKVWNDWVSG